MEYTFQNQNQEFNLDEDTDVPSVTYTEDKNKDRIALVISLVFVALLGFFGYRYFNQDAPVSDLPSADSGEILATNTEKVEETEAQTTEQDEQHADAASPESDAMETELVDQQEAKEQVMGATDIARTYWVANNYEQGDVQPGSYVIQDGDTLWEIAEGVYGNGADWVRILDANADSIGHLPNGQQALIMPGQMLNIPTM